MTTTEGDAEPVWYYDDPRTLAGALQRGRGVGALRARRDPDAAAELVRACVRRDHRWWWHLDEREVYLARLVRDLGLGSAPVLARLRETEHVPRAERDNSFELATGVLVALARGGDREAALGLAHYLDDGTRWISVLQRIAADYPADRWNQLRPLVRRRLTRELAAEAEQESAKGPASRFAELRPSAEPWRTWRRHTSNEEEAEREVAAEPEEEPGDLRDVPQLIATAVELRTEGEWTGFAPLADELARHGAEATTALPLLRDLFVWTPHSFERAALLRARLALDPHGSRRALWHSLWDCESEVRLIAVRTVPVARRTVERLTALAGDTMERADIRRIAAAKLAAAKAGAARRAPASEA
ncbi:hypothetical protein OG455_26885 [Kitasatospora sp. NBC_01287]|uniref:hypothetical protein n=1 Tax=Kitasatospora sp. NBC_01287 TaxID=2903573 RepID=UPI00224F3D70|nr:hypothetical protein [Kitasatospora sp. NBC_01287]MCX4749091.1 hypothetical protein [Kitasatospora sp. NBC_01287]